MDDAVLPAKRIGQLRSVQIGRHGHPLHLLRDPFGSARTRHHKAGNAPLREFVNQSSRDESGATCNNRAQLHFSNDTCQREASLLSTAKMRIALISQYFYPEQFSNNGIALELTDRGHEIHVFPCVPNYPAGRFFPGYSNTQMRSEIWNGIRISRAFTVPRGKSPISLLANYLCYPIAVSWTICRRMKEKADVSFVSMPSPIFQAMAGIILRWRTNTPCVYWVQDIWPESATYTLGIRNRVAVRILDHLCGWLYRQADLVMVQNSAFYPMISRFGVPADRIRVLPNTAPAGYAPVNKSDAYQYASLISQTGFRLMFAGNIGESQDFDTLVAAADVLRDRADLHWVVVGSGRDEERVKTKIDSMNLQDRFVFLGRYPEKEMPSIFAHADAMLISLKDIPIFSLTVPYKTQCYMACGKPIIAVLNGEGARIIEESGSGIVASAGDARGLASAIETMMDSTPAEMDRYQANSLNYFEVNFSAKEVFDGLELALKHAISPPAGIDVVDNHIPADKDF